MSLVLDEITNWQEIETLLEFEELQLQKEHLNMEVMADIPPVNYNNDLAFKDITGEHINKTHKRHKKHKRRSRSKKGTPDKQSADENKLIKMPSPISRRNGFGDADPQCTTRKDVNDAEPRVPSMTENTLDDGMDLEMELPDFSWLTKDFNVHDAVADVGFNAFDPFGEQIDRDDHIVPQSTSLSQMTTPAFDGFVDDEMVDDFADERQSIEEEIRKKYAELDKLVEQISTAKRQRRKVRRKKYHLRKYDIEKDMDLDEWVPSYVNIYPIKRRKRSAQPIRNAVLVRCAMKKTWKGTLGSCCGNSCWASWRWINLGNVISDYE